jgi:hypothetical protein
MELLRRVVWFLLFRGSGSTDQVLRKSSWKYRSGHVNPVVIVNFDGWLETMKLYTKL